MERKVGEVFDFDGVKLRVEKERAGCVDCYFRLHNKMWCLRQKALRGECAKVKRHTEGVIFVQIGDMEERAIKLTLEKAKEFYKKGGEFRDLALSAYTEKELKEIVLPKTWDEFCSMKKVQPGEAYYCFTTGDFVEYKYYSNRTKHSQQALPSLQDAKAHLALAQLHQLRDYYRQGWKPDFSDKATKYCVKVKKDYVYIYTSMETSCFLSFQTHDIANEFIENFKDLIFKAWDLL